MCRPLAQQLTRLLAFCFVLVSHAFVFRLVNRSRRRGESPAALCARTSRTSAPSRRATSRFCCPDAAAKSASRTEPSVNTIPTCRRVFVRDQAVAGPSDGTECGCDRLRRAVINEKSRRKEGPLAMLWLAQPHRLSSIPIDNCDDD